MSLTENQQAYIDHLHVSYQDFRQALIHALNSDNNRETHLDTAAEKQRAAQSRYQQLVWSLGTNSGLLARVTVDENGTTTSVTEELRLKRFNNTDVYAPQLIPQL